MVEQDGYYIMSAVCVILGGLLLTGFILPTVKRLQCESKFGFGSLYTIESWRRKLTDEALPMSAWRVKIPR